MMRTIFPLLALLLLNSCSTIYRPYWKKYHLAENSPGQETSTTFSIGGQFVRPNNPEDNNRIELGAEEIAQQSKWRFTSGMTTLSMPAGSRQDAKQIARWLDTAERETSQEFGVDRFIRLHFIGIDVPNDATSLAFSTNIEEPNTLPIIAPLWDNQKQPINLDPVTVIIAFHELYEMQLILNESAPTALPDVSLTIGPVKATVCAHTRWFRDGFATYAATIAAEKLSKLSQGEWPKDKTRSLKAFESPLRNLSQVGTSLFRWDQFSADRYSDKNYPASHGLFLLLEQRYGRAGIRRWIEAIKRQEIPDRGGILRAAKEAFGTDLRNLVRDYKFSETS